MAERATKSSAALNGNAHTVPVLPTRSGTPPGMEATWRATMTEVARTTPSLGAAMVAMWRGAAPGTGAMQEGRGVQTLAGAGAAAPERQAGVGPFPTMGTPAVHSPATTGHLSPLRGGPQGGALWEAPASEAALPGGHRAVEGG